MNGSDSSCTSDTGRDNMESAKVGNNSPDDFRLWTAKSLSLPRLGCLNRRHLISSRIRESQFRTRLVFGARDTGFKASSFPLSALNFSCQRYGVLSETENASSVATSPCFFQKERIRTRSSAVLVIHIPEAYRLMPCGKKSFCVAKLIEILISLGFLKSAICMWPYAMLDSKSVACRFFITTQVLWKL